MARVCEAIARIVHSAPKAPDDPGAQPVSRVPNCNMQDLTVHLEQLDFSKEAKNGGSLSKGIYLRGIYYIIYR